MPLKLNKYYYTVIKQITYTPQIELVVKKGNSWYVRLGYIDLFTTISHLAYPPPTPVPIYKYSVCGEV